MILSIQKHNFQELLQRHGFVLRGGLRKEETGDVFNALVTSRALLSWARASVCLMCMHQVQHPKCFTHYPSVYQNPPRVNPGDLSLSFRGYRYLRVQTVRRSLRIAHPFSAELPQGAAGPWQDARPTTVVLRARSAWWAEQHAKVGAGGTSPGRYAWRPVSSCFLFFFQRGAGHGVSSAASSEGLKGPRPSPEEARQGCR